VRRSTSSSSTHGEAWGNDLSALRKWQWRDRETNHHAHTLIVQMMQKGQKLDDRGDMQLKIAKVVFEIALGELTGYFPTKAGRIAVSVAYEMLGF
jgi:hypothetical protein